MRDGVAQWSLLTTGRHVRPDTVLRLRNERLGSYLGASSQPGMAPLAWAGEVDDSTPPVGSLTLRRRGPSMDPIRHGERVILRVAGGQLVVAASDAPPGVALCLAEVSTSALDAAEWEITGGAPGTAVRSDVPVGLLNHVLGDFLVVAARPFPGLAWWGDIGGGLPLPEALRAVPIAPGHAELSGRLTGCSAADGLEVVVRPSPAVAALLGDHLAARSRRPDASAVTARWTAPDGVPLDLSLLPPTGTTVRLSGVLVDDPALGLALQPLRCLIWSDAGGGLAATWHMLALPGCSPTLGDLVTCYLPLPSRSGEPGSTTTFTARPEPGSSGGARRVAVGAAALVSRPRTGRRWLRVPIDLQAARDGQPVRAVCAVRVHPDASVHASR